MSAPDNATGQGDFDVKTVTLEEFHASIKAQKAPEKIDITMICPMCGTHQSARDLIAAGAGSSFEHVEKYLGFSCVGRWLNAASPRETPDGKPCNWTLGGLFQLHKLEVVMPDGERCPRFEIAEISKQVGAGFLGRPGAAGA